MHTSINFAVSRNRIIHSVLFYFDLIAIHIACYFFCFVGELYDLEDLYLSDNKLKSLPDELALCTNLEILSAAHNELEMLPLEMVNIRMCSSIHIYSRRQYYLI